MTRFLPRRGTVVLRSDDPCAIYALAVRSNGVARDVLCWDDLTPAEQKEHNWGAEDHNFVRYRGYATPLESFTVCPGVLGDAGWDGASSDTWFSGLVIRLVDNGERAIVGRHWQTSEATE